VRIVIAGAGAIGGYIGARLARVGADVVLFARGPHLQAMRDRGLRVISPDGDFEVRPQLAADLGTIGPVDVVFLGVKAHALTSLAPQLRALFGPDTVVVSTQNGGDRTAAYCRVIGVLLDRRPRAGGDSSH
jgi:2-dehydropantoate 2-reductase